MALLTEKMDMDFRAITYDTALNNEANTYAAANAVDMKDANRVVFQVNCPTMATSGICIWTVEESVDTTDGNFATLSGYTVTHTQASSEADVWKTIEVPASAMSATKRYLRLKATASGSANIAVTAVACRELVYSNV